MGSLSSVRQHDLLFLAVPVLLGLAVLMALRWRMNLLTVSDEEAESMGVDLRRLRAVVIMCATLMTAASVAVAGLIGWIGLVIPHFCRLIFGYDYRRLIPATALMGGAFLIVVDDVARLTFVSELPIGILTAFIGAPVFAWLILTGGKNGNRT
jgi:iron complex transport system permease protein